MRQILRSISFELVYVVGSVIVGSYLIIGDLRRWGWLMAIWILGYAIAMSCDEAVKVLIVEKQWFPFRPREAVIPVPAGGEDEKAAEPPVQPESVEVAQAEVARPTNDNPPPP